MRPVCCGTRYAAAGTARKKPCASAARTPARQPTKVTTWTTARALMQTSESVAAIGQGR